MRKLTGDGGVTEQHQASEAWRGAGRGPPRRRRPGEGTLDDATLTARGPEAADDTTSALGCLRLLGERTSMPPASEAGVVPPVRHKVVI